MASTSRTTRAGALKRDSLAAELERDPQYSSAKRQLRKNVLNSSLNQSMLERDLNAAQTAKTELESKLREKEVTIERLEKDRRFFADRERAEREEKEKERTESDAEKSTLQAELRTLRSAFTKLQGEHEELKDEHTYLQRTTEQTISSQKSQLSTLQRQTRQLEQDLSRARSTANERDRVAQELQERVDDLTSAYDRISLKNSEQESMAVVCEELHRQTSYIRSLESKNVKLGAEVKVLKERSTSIEVLREEKRGLEKRVKGMDELRSKVVTLEGELETAKRERQELASKAELTPSSSTHALSSLRLKHATLLEEHGATVAELRRHEIELANALARESDAKDCVTQMEAEVQSLKQTLERKERTLAMNERELQFLQQLVASYKAEEAVSATSANPDATADAKDLRIQQLETLLTDYKTRNTQLASQLDTKDGGSLTIATQLRDVKALHARELDQEREKREACEADLKSALSENEKHLTKVEELEQTLFELSGEIAGGRHVPPKTRVLSMKDNPEQQWFDLRQQAMDRIKQENQALLNRLKELEEAGMRKGAGESGQGEDELVPRTSYELVCEEKKELEQVVKQRDKRLDRLKQLYASKSIEFREAVRFILGVKMVFYPNGQVRMTSIYDVNATFVFQPCKDGNIRMNLVAQGELAPEDTESMMRYWIQNEECVPGFMAALTLQCYENWKNNAERPEIVT